MIGIKDVPHNHEEPLFAQTTGIDTFLIGKVHFQSLFELLLACTHGSAYLLKTVVHHAFSPDTEVEMALDGAMSRDGIEIGFPSLELHLAMGIILQDLDLGTHGQEEGVLAKGVLCFLALPGLEVGNQVEVVEQRIVVVRCRQKLTMCSRSWARKRSHGSLCGSEDGTFGLPRVVGRE